MRRIFAASFLSLAVSASPAALAQNLSILDEQPSVSSTDENGVDLLTGKIGDYAFEVSIGDAADPAISAVVRRKPGSAAKAGTPFFGKITGVHCNDLTIATWCNHWRNVEFGSYSRWFWRDSYETPFRNQYGETYAVESGLHVITLKDGTRVRFDPAKSPPANNWDPDYELGRLLDITKPNGEILSYAAWGALGDGSQRASYVRSNKGYAVRFRGTPHDDNRYLNLSQTYCTSDGSCDSTIETARSTKITATSALLDPNGAQATLGCTIINGTDTICNAVDRAGRPYQWTERLFVHYFTPMHTFHYNAVVSVTRGGQTTSYAYQFSWHERFGGEIVSATATYPNGETRTASRSAGITIKDGNGPETRTGFHNSVVPPEFKSSESEPAFTVYSEGNRLDYTYDSRRNLTLVKLTPKPGSTLTPIESSAAYPATCDNLKTCNKPTYVIDAKLNRTDFEYSPVHGGVTVETLPAGPNGIRPQKRYSYAQFSARVKDASGQLVNDTPVWKLASMSACTTLASCTGTADEVITEYGYDDNLLTRTVTVRLGTGTVLSATTTSYDSSGNPVTIDGPKPGTADTTRNFFDANRNLVGTISPDPDGAGGNPNLATKTTYNAEGQPTLVQTGTAADQTEGALAAMSVVQQTSLTYDTAGRKTHEKVSGGSEARLTQYGYDLRGRLECSTVRMNPTAFGSPPAACLLGIEGSQGPDRITRNVYDVAGQVLQVQKGVGTALQQNYATYTYSPNGKRASVTDANGNKATMAYDGLDRQTHWYFPSKTSPGQVSTTDYEEYGYDANGNRTSLRKRDGRTIAFAYDALDRLSSKTYPGGGARPVYYAYDLRGLQTMARFDSLSGQGITNAYDGLGRLTATTAVMPLGAGEVIRNLNFLHDEAGNRTRITWPDGQYVTSFWNGLDRFFYRNTSAGTELNYVSYDAAGRVSLFYRWAAGTWGVSTSLGYDGISRLASYTHSFQNSAASGTTSFTYNPASQILSRTLSNDDYRYTNYANANRVYEANGLNQYSKVDNNTYTYDTNGNLTSDGGVTYTYDIENRLVGTSTGVTLSYDPLGRLAQVSQGVGTTQFLYDGDALVAEYDGAGTMTRRYVHGPAAGADDPLVEYVGSSLLSPRHLIPDNRGSIVAVADSSGNRVQLNSYDEYGVPGAGNGGRFQYTGQAWLQELGMYYYKARIYSPMLGRFLQTDPIGYDDQVNLYAYVANDPINLTDPTGMALANDELEKLWRKAAEAVEKAKKDTQRELSEAKEQLLQAKKQLEEAEDDIKGAVTEDIPDAVAATTDALKLTDHAVQRREEARAGDAHRDVGDPNRVVREGRAFRDTATGNTVYVSGNKMVVVDPTGERQISQRKITRADLNSRIRRQRLVPR